MTIKYFRTVLKNKNLLSLVIFIGFSCLMFLFIIINPMHLGISYDWNTPQSNYSYYQNPLDSSWVHNSLVSPGNLIYLRLYYKIFYLLGFDNIIVTLIFLVGIFLFSGYFLYLLLRHINLPWGIALGCGILYLTSSQLLLVTHHGYLNYLISFCFTPLMLLFYLRYLREKKIYLALLGGLIFSIAASQFQFVIINSLILLIFTFYKYKSWRYILRLFFVYIIVNILLSASWLLVYFSDTQGLTQFSNALLSYSYEGFQSNHVMDLFYIPFVSWSIKEFFTELEIKWFFNVWSFVGILFFVLPLIVYARYKKELTILVSRMYLICYTLLMVGILLAKGGAEPLSWLKDLFFSLPLSGIFRDLNHFYYLITLSSILLFAISIYVIYLNIKSNIFNKKIFVFVLCLFIIIYTIPFVLNVYQTRLHTYEFKGENYERLIGRYNSNPRNYKLLWLPLGFYVKYNDGKDLYTGINPLPNSVIKDSVDNLGSRPNQPSLLSKIIQFGYCGKIKGCTERLVGLFNIGEIINLKSDFSSTIPKGDDKNIYRQAGYWTLANTSNKLSVLKFADQVVTNEAFDIYQLNDDILLPQIYIPSTLSWIRGDHENLLDGVILNRDRKTAYITGNKQIDNLSNIIIPVEFSEDSLISLRHNSYQVITHVIFPEDGEYKLFFYQKHDHTNSPGYILNIVGVDHDNRQIIMEKVDDSIEKFNDTNLVESGYTFFKEGEYKLVISNAVNDQNLIINSSFEVGAWPGRRYNCTADELDLEVNISKERAHYLQFHNSDRGVCQTVSVGRLVPNQKYLFAYDIQHVAGEQPEVCLRQFDEDYCHGKNIEFESGNWQHHEFIFEQGDYESANITFTVPGSDQLSINNFDNFELRQVGLPETFSFVKEKNDSNASYSSIEYKKIHQTKYRVIIREAEGIIPLVFSEKYDNDWQAYIKSSKNKISDISGPKFIYTDSFSVKQNDNLPSGNIWETQSLNKINDHDEINGLSNIWYINIDNGPHDVEVIIEFGLQTKFKMGQYISIGTASLIVVFSLINYIIYKRSQRKMKKN